MRPRLPSTLFIGWALMLGTLLTVTLSGCNTMRGFGRDVERGGERVQDAATSTQNRIQTRAFEDAGARCFRANRAAHT